MEEVEFLPFIPKIQLLRLTSI